MIASAISTSGTITAPSDIQAGDLLALYQQSFGDGDPPTPVRPSGFTAGVDTNADPFPSTIIGWRTLVDFKIADGSEASASMTGMDATSDRKTLLVFRADGPIKSFSLSAAVGGQYTGGNPGAQTIATSSAAAPVIAFGTYHSFTAVSPRSFTVGGDAAKDGEVANNVNNYVAWKVFLSSPADVVVDMEDEGSDNVLHSFYLEIVGGDEEIVAEPAAISVAGQPVTVGIAEVLSKASIDLAGQALAFETRLALSPASFAFAGANIGFAYLQAQPAQLGFAGQVIDARALTPSRNRAPLRLPRDNSIPVGRRMPSYWKGVRN